MLKIDAAVEHVIRMHEERMMPVMISVRKFAELCIEDLRKMNDEATAEELPRNQGRIDAFKVIIDAIDEGIPRIEDHLRRQPKNP
jgi:hypothetical protein